MSDLYREAATPPGSGALVPDETVPWQLSADDPITDAADSELNAVLREGTA
jgi:hypothetical protein